MNLPNTRRSTSRSLPATPTLELSFASTGEAFDNPVMQTTWARLNVEIAWIRGSIRFDTLAQAHAYLFEFIEVFYNRQRHQIGLPHLTPAEYADR